MEIEKPSRTFDIKVGDDTQTITMSWALQQELMKVIPQPENIAALLIQDFYLREYIVRRVLTGKKKVTSDEDLIDLFELELDDDAVEALIMWVVDHILYFFTDTASKSLALGERYSEKMKALTRSAQSQTGSAN